MRFARVLVLALLAFAPFVAMATDAPHNASSPLTSVDCESCHMGHNATGSALTNNALGISALCQTCHSQVTNGAHGLPWSDPSQANPGMSGTNHNWSAPAVGHGATPPLSTSAMGKRLDTSGGTPGTLTCSVCHDQHNNWGRTGGTQHTSYTPGVAYLPGGVPYVSGNGRTVTLSPVASGVPAKGYRLQIVTAGSMTTARFKLSNDGGTSWFGCTTATTYPPTVQGILDTQNACRPAASVPLDANVTVGFATQQTGSFSVGDQWNFYVSYPFLRISNVDSAMCVVCHADRSMNHTRVAGGDPSYPANGTNVFSHPVGESLNVNGGNYDRGDSTTNNVLDANGALQTTGDGIASNNLKLGANNSVHCMTCHGPHNADSNSLTELP